MQGGSLFHSEGEALRGGPGGGGVGLLRATTMVAGGPCKADICTVNSVWERPGRPIYSTERAWRQGLGNESCKPVQCLELQMSGQGVGR